MDGAVEIATAMLDLADSFPDTSAAEFRDELKGFVKERIGREPTDVEMLDLLDVANRINVSRGKRWDKAQEAEAALDQIDALEDEYTAWWESGHRPDTLTELREFRDRIGKLVALQQRFQRLAEEAGLPAGEDVEIRTEQVRTMYAELQGIVGGLERQHRLEERAAHRPAEAVPETRRCSCGKPARIGDQCKKCARASGIIVHGKI